MSPKGAYHSLWIYPEAMAPASLSFLLFVISVWYTTRDKDILAEAAAWTSVLPLTGSGSLQVTHLHGVSSSRKWS